MSSSFLALNTSDCLGINIFWPSVSLEARFKTFSIQSLSASTDTPPAKTSASSTLEPCDNLNTPGFSTAPETSTIISDSALLRVSSELSIISTLFLGELGLFLAKNIPAPTNIKPIRRKAIGQRNLKKTSSKSNVKFGLLSLS